MTELFARLFPAIRDIRTPLAVGYTWLGLTWIVGFEVTNGSVGGSTPAVYEGTVAKLPALAAVAVLSFLAVILGSGIVRLMERIMQAIRTRGTTNPFDRARSEMVTDYITRKSSANRARQEWGGPEDDESLTADDLRLFLFYLRQDQDFGALQSEQLTRFSLLPPVIAASALAGVWLVQEWWDTGIALLVSGLLFVGFVLFLDYKRTGTLLKERWRSLADEYPTWLPDDAFARRNVRAERVREILASDGGLRSFTVLSAGGDQELSRQRSRLDALRTTASELSANGAPVLARRLRNALPDAPGDRPDSAKAKEFRDLAANWNGVWKTPRPDETLQ